MVEYKQVNDHIVIMPSNDIFEDDLIFPRKIDGLPITSIADKAFSGSMLTYVELPDRLEKIGYKSFYGCKSLEEIVIPDTVTKIGVLAFASCSALQKIKIPKSVVKFGDLVFKDCPESLTIYGERGSAAESYAKENGIRFADSSEFDKSGD